MLIKIRTVFFLIRSVRRAFELVADQSLNEKISLLQFQEALSRLGYKKNILSEDEFKKIILNHREIDSNQRENEQSPKIDTPNKQNKEISINFDEFCILTSYLAILQQEIQESGCISPIKGTNLPPPPIFLTNTPGI